MVDLTSYNPWWSNPTILAERPLVKRWAESRIRHDPGPRLAFQHDDLVYSLRGPRRVGKTTFLMREVQNLLQAIQPQNIFYYSFEVESNPVDVVNVIREYLASSGNATGRRFLLLDEISHVKDWQKAIKKLWDMGELVGCTIIVTDSNSTDAQAAAESMHGRRGAPGPDDPLDKILFPASFGEYVELASPPIKKALDNFSLLNPTERIKIFSSLCTGDIDERLYRLLTFRPDLESHLKNYLVSGGIPHVANELIANNTISPATYAQCVLSIKADLSLLGSNAARAFRILPNIVDTLGTPVSWRSLRKGTDTTNHHIVEESITALTDSFITFVLYKYDSEKKLPKYDAPKKVYFGDPYFLHALKSGHTDADLFSRSRHRAESPRHLPALMEQVVASHAARLAFSMSKNKHMFDHAEPVYYWRSRSGREVDVVFPVRDDLAAILVKYKNRIRADDLRGLFDLREETGSKGGIVVTRDTLGTQSGAALVPAFLFLLLA